MGSRWYGKNDKPLNKYESDCIENFKYSKFHQDLIYTYEDFELHNQNIVMLTSYDTGLLKIKGDLSDPVKIHLKFEKRIYDDVKLTSTYKDPFESFLNYVSCKYVLKDTHAESLGMMVNEKLSKPPELTIEEFKSKYLDEKLTPYSAFFRTTLAELHNRDSEYLLGDYVFCFTGIPMYSTISELIEIITKFGGRYIYVQDKSRSTALYANKNFPAEYDARDIKAQNKELVLLHGYDPEDCIRFKSNPISIGYPHIVNSNKYNLFKKFSSKFDNLKIIDEIELLSAIKECRIIFEEHMEPEILVKNNCHTNTLFNDGERQIMSWIQTVHNFGGRGTKAFAIFSKIAEEIDISKTEITDDKEKQEQIKKVFRKMKEHNVSEDIVNLAQQKFEEGAKKLTVKYIKEKLSEKLEHITGKYVKSSEILGSYKRNKDVHGNENYECGDVDVLLTCEENKRKCIEEYEEKISNSLWNNIKDYVGHTNIEEAVVPIDNGNKFRKYIIYIRYEDEIIPIRLDVKVAKTSEVHTMKLHQTGSSVFNTVMSNVAKEKGYEFSQLGLFKDGKLVDSEKKILKILLEDADMVKFYSDLTNRNKDKVSYAPGINIPKYWASVPKIYTPKFK